MPRAKHNTDPKIYLAVEDVLERFSISRRTLYNWIRVDGFPAPRRIRGKRYFRLVDVNGWDERQSGAPVVEPETALGLQVVSEVIRSYGEFVEAMKSRRVDLALSAIETEALSGLQEGYVSKLENPATRYGRGVGPDTLPLWLGGLRVGIVLVDLPRRPKKAGAGA